MRLGYKNGREQNGLCIEHAKERNSQRFLLKNDMKKQICRGQD